MVISSYRKWEWDQNRYNESTWEDFFGLQGYFIAYYPLKLWRVSFQALLESVKKAVMSISISISYTLIIMEFSIEHMGVQLNSVFFVCLVFLPALLQLALAR